MKVIVTLKDVTGEVYQSEAVTIETEHDREEYQKIKDMVVEKLSEMTRLTIPLNGRSQTFNPNNLIWVRFKEF